MILNDSQHRFIHKAVVQRLSMPQITFIRIMNTGNKECGKQNGFKRVWNKETMSDITSKTKSALNALIVQHFEYAH